MHAMYLYKILKSPKCLFYYFDTSKLNLVTYSALTHFSPVKAQIRIKSPWVTIGGFAC